MTTPCPGMHRPWDQREGGGGGGALQQGEGGRGNKASPLDALFNMISNNDALTAKSGKLIYDKVTWPIFICFNRNFCHIM